MTSTELDSISASSIQDYMVLKVATELDLNKDKYEMHQGDKIDKSTIGEMVQTCNQVQVKPFPESMGLVSKMREHANKVVTSKVANRSLYDQFLLINLGSPKCVLKLDLNGTRVSSVYKLMRSSLFLRKSLAIFFVETTLTSSSPLKIGIYVEKLKECFIYRRN